MGGAGTRRRRGWIGDAHLARLGDVDVPQVGAHDRAGGGAGANRPRPHLLRGAPEDIEPLAGMSILNGIPIRIAPAGVNRVDHHEGDPPP